MGKTKKVFKSEDIEFHYLLRLDPGLETWRELAATWLATQLRGTAKRKAALNKFFEGYIHGLGLPKFPADFLTTLYEPPCFSDHLSDLSKNMKVEYNNSIVEFLDWVLENRFTAEDDDGRVAVAPGFGNPLTRKKKGGCNVETNKAPLPHRYIKELRQILCPHEAQSFSDWTWAIANSMHGSNGSDWIRVDPLLIDENDPDCVLRKRLVPIYSTVGSRHKIGEQEIVELWSPVRWVALYVKLELPLRTGQVRWLDSGEADTFRHEGRQWVRNPSPLAQGTEKRPYQKGVFRRSPDLETGEDKCALFINTNKTADIDKAEDAKGYVVPWEHPRILPWLERLRDWQAKYNPIEAAVPWSDLKQKHLKNIKHSEILVEMGEACFLFRDAANKYEEDRDKPIPDNNLNLGWRRLLIELERRCKARGETLKGGQKIVFVNPDSPAGSNFPLHSLRVSLITAFAMEGGVPLAVLSKCIAGHANIIMTLYYTKAGVGRVTEVMGEAERKMLVRDKESYRSFLADATYRLIEQASAFNDPAAVQAVVDNRSPAGWVVEDKGICPLGCGGCDKGFLLLRQGKEKPDTVPVPGYPREKNCVRCRFFLSGPAFLDGLLDHFNSLSYQMGDASKRYIRLEHQVEALQNEQFACTEAGRPFTRTVELEKLSRVSEIEAEQCNKLGEDMNATACLVKRSIEIKKAGNGAEDGKLSLVAVGGMEDLGFAFAEVSEMHQLEVLCENATFYPEADAAKATLRRSQILDACLEMNGRGPVFFKLSPDLQHQVGNEFMKLLKLREGSIKGAVDVIEGMKSLEDIGLLSEVNELLESRTGQPLMLNGTISVQLLPTGTGGK